MGDNCPHVALKETKTVTVLYPNKLQVTKKISQTHLLAFPGGFWPHTNRSPQSTGTWRGLGFSSDAPFHNTYEPAHNILKLNSQWDSGLIHLSFFSEPFTWAACQYWGCEGSSPQMPCNPERWEHHESSLQVAPEHNVNGHRAREKSKSPLDTDQTSITFYIRNTTRHTQSGSQWDGSFFSNHPHINNS